MNDLATRLAELARRGEATTYAALARELGWRMSVLTQALETSMVEDAAAGRPFRAVLLESRLTPGLPAEGFFLKAMELSRPIARSPEAILRERTAVRLALASDGYI